MREFCTSGSVGGRGGQLPRSTRHRHLISSRVKEFFGPTVFDLLSTDEQSHVSAHNSGCSSIDGLDATSLR